MNKQAMNKPPIRKATVDDVPLILDFIKALAVYEKMADDVEATEEQLASNLFGDEPQAEVLIAEWAGEPAGFALFFHNFSTFRGKRGLYLEDLFVKPDFRGKGIGKALLQELAGIAVARDCGRFEWAVLDWNSSAIAFYESMGARVVHEWKICRVDGDALKRLGSQ